jgi:lipase
VTVQAGFESHVMTLGEGPRRALALHCTMAFSGAWAGFARYLNDTLTLIAPDLPSHGRSADWDELSDFSETSYAGALAVMDDGPMDLIGHSFGGAIALRLAVAHPEKVKSLTVIEPVFFAVAAAHQPEAVRDHADHLEPAIAALRSGDRETAARIFNGMWSDEGPQWSSLAAKTRAAMMRAIHVLPAQHAFLFDDTAGMLSPGGLDALCVPTLIVRGALSPPAIVATNDGLEQIIPNAVQTVVEGAGHMVAISHPKPVADAVKTLLERS